MFGPGCLISPEYAPTAEQDAVRSWGWVAPDVPSRHHLQGLPRLSYTLAVFDWLTP